MAAIRDHLGQTLSADSASCSIVLDEVDLLESAARRALLLLWNLGHLKGPKHSLMAGGHKKPTNLFAPMFAAGLGRILGPAQLSRTFVLRMRPYDEKTKPELDSTAPGDEVDTAESRKETTDTFYRYLRYWAETREFALQPRMPAGIIRRSADNFRSLLSVADVCGGDWPRRAREALVTLIKETTDDQPKAIILRHGRLLFERLETDELEVGLFNRELRKLSEPEFDWNRYRGPTGNQNEHPISISEQGRLLAPKSDRKRNGRLRGRSASPGIASAFSSAANSRRPARQGRRQPRCFGSSPRRSSSAAQPARPPAQFLCNRVTTSPPGGRRCASG